MELHFQLSRQILSGNANTYTVVENTLEPIVIATKIRLVPHSLHRRTVCLRLELFGCQFQGSLSPRLLEIQFQTVDLAHVNNILLSWYSVSFSYELSSCLGGSLYYLILNNLFIKKYIY